MENTDPEYVKLELDTAHLFAGEGDPPKTVEKYHDRLLFMHLKDVVSKFVELGQGKWTSVRFLPL